MEKEEPHIQFDCRTCGAKKGSPGYLLTQSDHQELRCSKCHRYNMRIPIVITKKLDIVNFTNDIPAKELSYVELAKQRFAKKRLEAARN